MVYFLSALLTIVHAKDVEKSQSGDKTILTAEIAITRAVEYSGFDKADGYDCQKSVSAELVLAANDNTPFVAEKINGRNIWQVTFRDIPVGQGTTKIRERDFEVTLDPETGKLIKIFSISDTEGSSDTIPQPSAKKAEEWFKARKYVFNQLPDVTGDLPFWQALQKVWIANPARTKIIKAYYWDYSDSNGRHPFTWFIILRGIKDPLPNAGPVKTPDCGRNFMMSAINAESGILMYTVTAPYDNEDAKKR